MPTRGIRLAIVTNIPAPYRVPVYDRIAAEPGIELLAVYAARTEPDRHWDLPPLAHRHVVMAPRMVERAGRFIHYNPDVWKALADFAPDVVVTTGYNPTHLLAWLFALLDRREHVVMTDGTDLSEARLSGLHRAVRRIVFATTSAFVVASHGGWRLLRGYGVPESRIHYSPLCANLAVDWAGSGSAERDIDLLFSGRLVAVKNPEFALEVADAAARRLGRRLRFAMLGSGPREEALRRLAAPMSERVELLLPGHVSQADIPRWFERARLFLFPTRWDPWGVVANEACLAGVPVIASPHAGAAGELVRDGINGRVLELDAVRWTDAVVELLADEPRRARLAAAARAGVRPYDDENAALGVIDAARQAVDRGAPRHSRFRHRPRVVCVQRRLTHYRVPLFEALRARLAERDIDFVLVHGDPTADEASKNDGGSLPWALKVPTHYAWGGRLCWQNWGDTATGADLVIVTQENRLLFNLVAMTLMRPARLAFWGHGRNFQARRRDGLRERFKRFTANHVDWWFAYTAASRDLVARDGFPAGRITTLDNAVDTRQLVADCRAVSAADIAALRARLQIGDGALGVFVGSLYAEKRLGFLIDAADALARRHPGFHLLVVGDGPERGFVDAAARRLPWLRVLGTRFGRDKAVCLRAARLMLNPGLVGLGVLDAFAAGLPLVTTDCGLHSPEIAYLRDGENGFVTANRADAFVARCEALLCDDELHRRQTEAAARDAQRYTIENMVEHFADGIAAALALPAR